MKIKTIVESDGKLSLQIKPENEEEEKKLDLALEGLSDVDNWEELKRRLEYNLKKYKIKQGE